MPKRSASRVVVLAAAAAAGFFSSAHEARAFDPYLVVPEPAVAENTPAYRYANMTDAEAIAELDKRKILYEVVASAPGVRAPVRLTGRLHGVYIHSSLPPDQRVTSPFEICDARLALALDDFAAILEKHDIDEIVHYTMYRPSGGGGEHGPIETPEPTTTSRPASAKAAKPSKPVKPSLTKGALEPKAKTSAPSSSKLKTSPDDPKPRAIVKSPPSAKKPAPASPAASSHPAKLPPLAPVILVPRPQKPPPSAPKVDVAPPGTRHPAGLAIDVGLLHKKDGRWLSVARMFHGKIGDKTCGEGARIPDDPLAKELHSIVCEQGDAGVFTYVLTPNYNQAHSDHFHMEIKPGVHWFLYH